MVLKLRDKNKGEPLNMAMSTDNTAALTRASRKLKELASDAISIPSAQELYDRKSAELRHARQKLDGIVKRQIAIEKGKSRSSGDTAAVVAEKVAAEALITRLENEAGLLKQPLIDARPKPPLTPQQQMWADAALAVAEFDPYHRVKRGTPEQIAAAQQAVDELVHEYRMKQPSGNAGAAWAAKSLRGTHAAHRTPRAALSAQYAVVQQRDAEGGAREGGT